MASACYVYAVLGGEALLPADVLGLGGAPVIAVPWRALGAATSYADQAELTPTPERVLRHEAVIEALRQCGPALPVRFGTAFADQGALQRALAGRYAVLLADLARLGDKVELGLTVLWNAPEPGDEEAIALDAGRPLHGTAIGAGRRYLSVRLAEHRQAARLQSRAKSLAQDIDDALKGQAIESRTVTLPTPRLLLRGAYLVEPSSVGTFRATFEGVRRAHPGLRFLLSGPWPPYTFVTPPEATLRPGDIGLDPIADSPCVRGPGSRFVQQIAERSSSENAQSLSEEECM